MEGKYTVHYLSHSAWAIETGKYLLLFDCDDRIPHIGNLSDGAVDLSLYGDKTIVAFYSHSHWDHYGKSLHRISQHYENVYSVLGGFHTDFKRNTITVSSRITMEKLFDPGLIIRTGGSTDTGVCFLAEANGLTIFHGGDNADWGDGDPANAIYYDEIDYIAGLARKIDLAFIPVCTSSGTRPADMTVGAIYAIEKLKPSLVFPMHANGRETLYEEFAADLRNSEIDNSNCTVMCMKSPGQKYVG